MLKKVEANCKRCKKEFWKKRIEQEFCSAQCRNASWKRRRKTRLKGTPLGSVANSPFSSIKTVACKLPYTPDLGPFVRAQIVAQKDELNPIGFSLPDGANCRAWLASDSEGDRIIGDDRWWRLNATELCKRRPASAKVRAILRTNDDGTYYITIDYDGSHEVIERSEMPEEDVGAILAAWDYLGTFAFKLGVILGRHLCDERWDNPDPRSGEAQTGSHQGFPRTPLHRSGKGTSSSRLRLADRHLSVSRRQSSSASQRQHRHDEAEGFQGIGGCDESDQAQATGSPIGCLKPDLVHCESGGCITGSKSSLTV
jgi:hypothetical protein